MLLQYAAQNQGFLCTRVCNVCTHFGEDQWVVQVVVISVCDCVCCVVKRSVCEVWIPRGLPSPS